MGNKRVKIGIIGGGASGMMAAVSAAEIIPGIEIGIFEKNDRFGRKILATGNGKCNFSNRNCSYKEYRGQDPLFAQKALEAMDPRDTVLFFEKLGIFTREDKQGRLYPYSEQALSVKEAFETMLKALNVRCILGKAVTKIEKTEKGFGIILSDEEHYEAETLIIATGGKAGSQFGVTGDGYRMAKDFGHTLISPKPALVQMNTSDIHFKTLKGVRAKGGVTLIQGGKPLAYEKGEIQFADTGLSGICIFDLSRFLEPGTNEAYVEIDLFPDFTREILLEKLIKRRNYLRNREVETFLEGMMHKKLIPAYLNRWNIDKALPLDVLFFEDFKKLAGILKSWKVPITGTRGWQDAQITAGGIHVGEVNSGTMASKLTPGLYFAGEILDIDGRCGGWNLQWAWSSGYLAGRNAAIRQGDV
ncbi:MAG: NAD(P)/FAD-dependent oxidoreductase [Eubacteriales bacterium]|nr:NAD(P)/FAD-dependent oxidoreductase [Eubacteriales bacterium]MDD4583199.1 NAD(P)/FAD-dependent oxidoreductase [Eubacteriales bacterium]